MKRIIILLWTALIALFLVSCSMQSSGINQGDEKKAVGEFGNKSGGKGIQLRRHLPAQHLLKSK